MGDSSGSSTYSDSPRHMSSISHDSVWNLLQAPSSVSHPGLLRPCSSSMYSRSSFPNQDHSAVNAILGTYSADGDSYRRYRRSQPSIPDGQHSYSHRCVPREISPRPRRRQLLAEAEYLPRIGEQVHRAPCPCRTEQSSFPDQVPINYH